MKVLIIAITLLLSAPYPELHAHRATAQCKIKRVFIVNGPTCWGGYDFNECTGEVVSYFAYCT